MTFLHNAYCTVGKQREKLPSYGVLFSNSTPGLYVEVQCIQSWVENGLVEPPNAAREKWKKGHKSILAK